MKRLVVLLALCALLGSGLLPRVGRATPPAIDDSWPDSLAAVRGYTEALSRLVIDRDTLEGHRRLLEVVAADSTYAPAWYTLASWSPESDTLTAVEWARRAHRLDTANRWYLDLYARRLVFAGRYDEARPLYARLTQIAPSNPDHYRILAILYQQAGRPYEAIATLDTAEMRLSYQPFLMLLKSRLLIDTRQYERAIELARRQIEVTPYDPAAHTTLADLYATTGHDSLALAEYHAALRIDSTDLPSLASLAEYYNRRNDIRSYLSVSKRIFEVETLPLAEKLRIFGQLTLDTRFYGNHYFQLGELISTLAVRYPDEREVIDQYARHLIAGGNLDEALALYKLHLDDQPPVADYYRMVIDLHAYRGELDSVDRTIARALELFPDDGDLYARRGHAQLYAGRPHEALESYRAALDRTQSDSLRSVLWCSVGDTRQRLVDEEPHRAKAHTRKSFAAYERALAAWADNDMALNNYAYFLSLAGRDLDRALAMAERAVALSERNATYLDTHAWVLYRLGRYAEARRVMQQAISFDTQRSPDLFLHYGDILEALGEKFMAETYWRKALDAGYEDPAAIAERIERLKQKP